MHSQGRVGDIFTVEILQKEERLGGAAWQIQTHSSERQYHQGLLQLGHHILGVRWEETAAAHFTGDTA